MFNFIARNDIYNAIFLDENGTKFYCVEVFSSFHKKISQLKLNYFRFTF